MEAWFEEVSKQLDPASRVPLYEQLASRIEQAILARVLLPGNMLPREQDLALQLRLGRQTVNQALSNLTRRGLLTRRRGVGTFVAEPYIEQPLGYVYSFLRTLLAQGRSPSTEILGYGLATDGQAAQILLGSPTGLLFKLQRLRRVDGEPFAFETIYLPHKCGHALPLDRVVQEPLYDLLREFCGLHVTRADETLRPVVLDEPEVSLLGVSAGDPAFSVERTGYAGDRPVELRSSLIRGDRFRFRVSLIEQEKGIGD